MWWRRKASLYTPIVARQATIKPQAAEVEQLDCPNSQVVKGDNCHDNDKAGMVAKMEKDTGERKVAVHKPDLKREKSDDETTLENSQKRGRPKLEEISSLIKEGAQSTSPIRCRFCKRAFPREKSLQAHQRIHTGERPYRCNYPGCHKSFVQSGQLRTHQRLHTGEKPFRCNECKNRFTHANRRCPIHPSAGVSRDEPQHESTRRVLCNFENLAELGNWNRRDELIGALALIELSQCH